MTTHISLRLAWHSDGWNGHICKEPHKNSYCVGPNSYPGDLIASSRDLEWERERCGSHCLELYEKEGKIPPCSYSINAYGENDILVRAEPPDFFQRWRTNENLENSPVYGNNLAL
ncbi:unnamed protein product [marine sediment metagenome]|uniref:Uncharacterized protein n=1 Tax=marine sediment metagenome TaxID=412755 RepID=X1PYX6_9ZZZZ